MRCLKLLIQWDEKCICYGKQNTRKQMQSADTIPAWFATEREHEKNLQSVWCHETAHGPSSPAGQPQSTHPSLQAPRQQHQRAYTTRHSGRAVHTPVRVRPRKRACSSPGRATPQASERRRRQGSSRHVQRLKRAPRVRVRPDSIKLSTILSIAHGSVHVASRRQGRASQDHRGEGNGEGIGERGTCACGGSRNTSPLALTCTVGDIRKRPGPGLGRTASSSSCGEYSDDDAADGARRSTAIRRLGGVARPRRPDILPEVAPEPSRECTTLGPTRSGNCAA